MSTPNLGRLERVNLRSAWTTEAGDFTPWLARPENLALLGDAIGLSLEMEAQEKSVGPFRADILCRGAATDHWVLVENQLERTDHTHLGQLLTYAAALRTVTIVWLAERFTDEHRAALDWLNEITDDRFSFFGLEIELWRIDSSAMAPKFNVVCQPNDWSRSVAGAAKSLDEGALSETQLMQREYWAGLRELLLERGGAVRPQKPLPQYWATFAIGRTNFSLVASVNTQRGGIKVQLSCLGAEGKAHFYLLKRQREEIEQDLGFALDWEDAPDRKESRIAITSPIADPSDRDAWPEQHEWIASTLEAMHSALASRVAALDASEWTGPDDEGSIEDAA